MTHRRAGAHKHTRSDKSLHTCTQRWQNELGNSLRTPRRPDALPNATRAHMHALAFCTITLRNAPSVGSVPPRTATRDGRKGVCQRPLLSSQTGTQTQAREQQPDCAAPGTGAIFAQDTWSAHGVLGEPSAPSHSKADSVHQTTVQTDSLRFTALVGAGPISESHVQTQKV